jgi:outer membrane receptor protein involved in Fe transport
LIYPPGSRFLILKPEIDQKTKQKIRSSPTHKVNFGIRFKHKSGFSTNWLIHYVGQTEWPVSTDLDLTPDEYAKVDPYTIVNLRLGYFVFKDRGEIFLSAFNAFNNKHLEYYRGEEVGRRITGGATFKF